MEEWEKAAKDQIQQQEWLTSITAKFEQPELIQAKNQYEVWRRAMELFRSYVKQTVGAWNEQLSSGSASPLFKKYGTLSFEKYLSLRDGISAKRTWDFGVDFKRGDDRARYLFFYGFADYRLRRRARVILVIARDIDFSYEPLQDITKSNMPDIYQVGFDITEQTFVALTINGVQEVKVEELARRFFEQVVQRDFGG